MSKQNALIKRLLVDYGSEVRVHSFKLFSLKKTQAKNYRVVHYCSLNTLDH